MFVELFFYCTWESAGQLCRQSARESTSVGCVVKYTLTLLINESIEDQLKFEIDLSAPPSNWPVDRVFLVYLSTRKESFFGFGEQVRVYNILMSIPI